MTLMTPAGGRAEHHPAQRCHRSIRCAVPTEDRGSAGVTAVVEKVSESGPVRALTYASGHPGPTPTKGVEANTGIALSGLNAA
jgi:hypothetical protein